jgi:hypothetical protein
MSACSRISNDQRRALRLLAGGPHGCTEAIMLAHGFKPDLLAALVRDGLATTQPGTIRAGRRQLDVVWVMITDADHHVIIGEVVEAHLNKPLSGRPDAAILEMKDLGDNVFYGG